MGNKKVLNVGNQSERQTDRWQVTLDGVRGVKGKAAEWSSLQWRPRKQCTSKAGSLKDKFIQKSKIQALYTYPMEMPLKLCFANIAWRWVDVFICGWTSGGSWEHPVFNWFSHLTWPDSFNCEGDHFLKCSHKMMTEDWKYPVNAHFLRATRNTTSTKKPHIALHDI